MSTEDDELSPARVSDLLCVMARVYDHAGWHPGSGLVRCPVCRQGDIAYRVHVEGVRRHMRARCSTVGCVQVGP
jgi:hypothetical protein